MRNFKKILALLLATMMIAGMAMSAVVYGAGSSGATSSSGTNTHTITITNTDQNVSHNYVAYQIFSGNLDKEGQGSKLSNIEWGSGVDGDALLAALKATTDPALMVVVPVLDASGTPTGETTKQNAFLNCTTAADVADVLSTFTSTGAWTPSGSHIEGDGLEESAGAIDAFASIVAENLASSCATFTEGSGTNAGTYTATVPGDGYYFIKDTTEVLSASGTSGTTKSDTLSKYILAVVRDTTVVAKDTGITTDKKIKGSGTTRLAADSSNIGDTVTFEVTVNVPNTKKYEDHFVFVMNDQLPAGLTFTGITSVEVKGKSLSDATKTTPNHTADGYDGTNGFYTLKVGADSSATPAVPAVTSGSYPFEAADYDAVANAGGQKIELTFNEFKKFAEKNELIGETITITYTAVVNDDAKFSTTANENEVKFDYSNDPNHDYHGDNPSGNEPMGETPKSKTRTYTTSLQIFKVSDESGTNPLAGAIFQLTGDAMNRAVVTGEKYVKDGYVVSGLGEEIDNTTKYWKLKDGSYTTTDPATPGMNTSKYESTTQIYRKVTFNVVEESGTTTSIIVSSNSDGIIQFTGLTAGTYTLEEIAAPEGYNKIEGTATITITWYDPEGECPSGTSADDWETIKSQGGYKIEATDFAKDGFTFTGESGSSYFKLQVVNKSGTELPSTGGIGTTIFYIVGGLLAVGAGVVLVSKKRMSKEEN